MALSRSLQKLEPKGSTALGPALVVGLAIAGKKKGSRLILCTDGVATVGPGSLDHLTKKSTKEEYEAVENWYINMGNSALECGTIVDVISITGDQCRLEMLGKVSDITNGTVTSVNPLTPESNFDEPLMKRIVATNVSVTMLLHHGLRFRDAEEIAVENNEIEEKAESPTPILKVSKRQIEVANALEETEVFFEYTVASKDVMDSFKHLTEIPFQVQIRYKKLDGSSCLRVLSKAQIMERRGSNDYAEEDKFSMNFRRSKKRSYSQAEMMYRNKIVSSSRFAS